MSMRLPAGGREEGGGGGGTRSVRARPTLLPSEPVLNRVHGGRIWEE